MEASLSGHAEVVDTLLQHEASVDLQNNVSAEFLYLSIYIMCNYISRC